MNTIERIAKMEKELEELKKEMNSVESYSKYTPRPGEICEFGDGDDKWCVGRFVEYDSEKNYPYTFDGDGVAARCRQLQDPMVIQLIRRNPEDVHMPCFDHETVIVLTGEDKYDVGPAGDYNWKSSQIKAWIKLP
jgi:hypothetical protein